MRLACHNRHPHILSIQMSRYRRIPPKDARLARGRRLFNQGAFFQSHEVWESLWHEVDGPERELLQGLIQLAAAYHHLRRDNLAGARYLYDRGRAKVASWLPTHAGLALQDWLAQIDEQFARIGSDCPPARGAPRVKPMGRNPERESKGRSPQLCRARSPQSSTQGRKTVDKENGKAYLA